MTNLAHEPALPDHDAIAEIFAALAIEGSSVIMDLYGRDANARLKPDKSVVCDADTRGEAIITRGLAARLPGLPVVAEEAVSRGEWTQCGRTFVLVDALDGTREFLSGNGEFTINIALIADHVPRAGVVYAPALERLWMGGTHAHVVDVRPGTALPPPTERRPISARAYAEGRAVGMVSRSHGDPETEDFLARCRVAERREAGSSLKFCLVAEGEADVYPRFGRTMEWDTAAGDAVLRSAGGLVVDLGGTPLHYGKNTRSYENDAFIAWGDPSRHSWVAAALR